MFRIFSVLFCMLLIAGSCDMPPMEESVQYLLTFESTWSSDTHPTDFPANPHFSGLIGAAHSTDIQLWEVGQKATPGIKNMAETGGKSPLDDEINSLISAGSACFLISGGGISSSPGSVTVTVTASVDCSAVSAVSMIAPSPDWFVGVSAVNLYDNGDWVDQKVIELFPYDAGTDSGSTYTSADEPTTQPEDIYRIEAEPFLVAGTVPSLGTFTFTRINPDEDSSLF